VVKAHKGREPIRFAERFRISNGLNLVCVIILFLVEIARLNDSWADVQVNLFCFALLQLDVSSVIDVRLYELSTVLGVSVSGLVEQLHSILRLLKEVVSLIFSGTSFSLDAALVDFVIKSQFCKISGAFTFSNNSLVSLVHTFE
jgi:phosphatidylinositol kinase/protein kinase (PI-3  family)